MPAALLEVPASAELSKLLDLYAAGDRLPVPDKPEPAVCVIFMRESPDGLELFMTRNSSARGDDDSNRWGFPFTTVRASDTRLNQTSGWNSAKCARMLRKDNETRSLMYFAAAGRLAFECTGVLLAEDADGHVVTSEEAPFVRASRQDLLDGNTTFAEVLRARELTLRPDLLHPWLRWINTQWQLRRYDTVYFTAVVPPGQEIDFISRHNQWGGWVKPAAVLDACGEDSADFISGPVRLVCESFHNVRTPGAAMCKIRDITPITPEVFKRDGQWWVSLAPLADPSQRGTLRNLDAVDEDPAAEHDDALLSDNDDGAEGNEEAAEDV